MNDRVVVTFSCIEVLFHPEGLGQLPSAIESVYLPCVNRTRNPLTNEIKTEKTVQTNCRSGTKNNRIIESTTALELPMCLHK